ncbi:MAG TPA: hypothetical protein VGM29_18600 [Polyangiaceae bacterium]|jgi:hypothetical protein
MQLMTSSVKALPQSWFVQNAGVTVGPVPMDLLLRGVLAERIPRSSRVRELSWTNFRALEQIREVRALQTQLSTPSYARPPSLWDVAVELADTEPSDVWTVSLQLAVQATHACVGLVHRLRAPLFLPTTSTSLGVDVAHLGEVVPFADAAFEAARRDMIIIGSAKAGLAERAIAGRLGPVKGVAMIPVTVQSRLIAMLELGRTDHEFRASDAEGLSLLARAVGERASAPKNACGVLVS